MSEIEDQQFDDETERGAEPANAGLQPKSTGPRLSFSMKTRNTFFDRVATRLRSALPEEYRSFSSRPSFNLMKIAYDNERVHYEVAFDSTRELLEVALHFEDGPVSTAAYLRYFDRRIVEVKHLLGPEADLERWTISWARIYEISTLTSLDREVSDHVAERLARYITTLQPMLEDARVKPERAVHGAAARSVRTRKTGS